MSAPDLISGSSDISGGAHVVPKPAGVQLQDLLVVSFLMNGTPTLPAGFTLKQTEGDAHVVVYARVDGTVITAANDGQVFTFGDGGGAVYYTHSVVLIRGAEDTGDPFDGALDLSAAASNSATTVPVNITTTVDEVLLVMFTHELFTETAVSSVTAPIGMVSTAAAFSHIGSAPFDTPAATGDKVLTYAASVTASWAQLGAIKPAMWGPVEGRMYPGGRDRFTARRTPANRRRTK